MAGAGGIGSTEIQTGQTIKVDSAPGLYVHIPFCLSRCGYCAFVSGLYDESDADAYLAVLRRELTARRIFSPSVVPSTFFIGGGTPSALSPAQLSRLFSFLPLPKDGGEASCEMNPDSASAEKLSIVRESGINRISFGVQTFSEKGLRLLGRRHDSARAEKVVAEAFRLGFSRISIDLISCWPGQTEQDLEEDLRRALGMGVEHVSCYTFMLEEGTPGYAAYSGMFRDDGGEWERRCWDLTEEWLCGRGGFRHYEVSNFARPGGECEHNTAIWRGGEYVGIGVAACGFLSGRRYGNVADLSAYLRFPAGGDVHALEAWSERLHVEEAARECAVFWLRLYEGVELALFRARTGVDFFALYGGRIEVLLSEGVMEYCGGGGRIRVKPEWMPVLDSLLVDLV